MADSKRIQVNNYVKTDKAQLDETHAGDDSTETYVIDATGHGTGMITFYPPAGFTTGDYKVHEGPYEGAPSDHFEEIASGSDSSELAASTLHVVRINVINGAALKVELTADAAVQVVAVTH